MNINEKTKASTCVERHLVQLHRGFKRCHDRFPSIYHELWEPQVAIENALPGVLKPVSMDVGGTTVAIYDEPDLWGMADSFRKANAIELPYSWTRWHEPHGARYFGCFYGEDGAVWDDFGRLAGSAYLVLRQIDTSLPDDDFHGWMKVVHAMACGEPTPLLRSHSVVWRDWECESAEDHERWIMPKAGAPYPEHPVCRTLELDVITSSMAAIERLLDGECVISLGPPMPEPLAGQEDRNGDLPSPDERHEKVLVPPPGKPGRKKTTADIAEFAEIGRLKGQTWKEIYHEWKRLHPDDQRVKSSEQIREAYRRAFGDKARKVY